MLSLTVLLSILSVVGATPAPIPTPAPYYDSLVPRTKPGVGSHGTTWVNYTAVPGFFLQDDEKTDPTIFDYTKENFGLINQTYPTDFQLPKDATHWQRFERYVESLNKNASSTVNYKVLFLARHGEGFHNAAETYYGTPNWDCYYSLVDGNATVTWADAHLTPNGIAQAKIAANYWLSNIQVEKTPSPQSYYTSPLYRCLQTSNITFSTLSLPESRPFKPLIKELFRESISGHTCDQRSNRTFIQESFPTYAIEQGFSEKDPLWRPLFGEPAFNQDIRSKEVLDDVFGSDKNTWISITSHSGEIASILRVVEHRPFKLATGGNIVSSTMDTSEDLYKPSPTRSYKVEWKETGEQKRVRFIQIRWIISWYRQSMIDQTSSQMTLDSYSIYKFVRIKAIRKVQIEVRDWESDEIEPDIITENDDIRDFVEVE
ncbi:hypothetical protein EYC80_002002 [Monilinia laxa]|uniref:Phosphoglycerate mutase-like protein n=1 Tax=Monilinia laxa TaxID=61186 RepID=A0A5N6K6V7_MONLA|nr:hypothetical protein EYC80_002002 [Monilinia laxa]